MPTRRQVSIPVTFPGVEEPLRSSLERFARDVAEQIDANLRDDTRPLAGSSEPLGAGGVYTVDPGTSAVDRELPALEFEDAGARVTFVRRGLGTAVLRPPAPATIAGEQEFFLPQRLGAFELLWDGSDWTLVAPDPPAKNEFSADQLRGGPFAAALGVSGSATLINDPNATGVLVRGFGARGHDAVRREFSVPTSLAGSLVLKTYYRAQSGPASHAVVHRRLHARQYAQSTGIPSGYFTYTLPSVTMPSGSNGWVYREDKVPLNQLGISNGRVEVVFSRPSAFPYAAPDLDCMLLIESLTLELQA